VSERVIETVKFKSVMELAELLEDRAYQTAGIQQADGREVRAFQIIETTLSDKVKVLDIRFVPWVVPGCQQCGGRLNYSLDGVLLPICYACSRAEVKP